MHSCVNITNVAAGKGGANFNSSFINDASSFSCWLYFKLKISRPAKSLKLSNNCSGVVAFSIK